jgi:hypothetical protein
VLFGRARTPESAAAAHDDRVADQFERLACPTSRHPTRSTCAFCSHDQPDREHTGLPLVHRRGSGEARGRPGNRWRRGYPPAFQEQLEWMSSPECRLTHHVGLRPSVFSGPAQL